MVEMLTPQQRLLAACTPDDVSTLEEWTEQHRLGEEERAQIPVTGDLAMLPPEQRAAWAQSVINFLQSKGLPPMKVTDMEIDTDKKSQIVLLELEVVDRDNSVPFSEEEEELIDNGLEKLYVQAEKYFQLQNANRALA